MVRAVFIDLNGQSTEYNVEAHKWDEAAKKLMEIISPGNKVFLWRDFQTREREKVHPNAEAVYDCGVGESQIGTLYLYLK